MKEKKKKNAESHCQDLHRDWHVLLDISFEGKTEKSGTKKNEKERKKKTAESRLRILHRCWRVLVIFFEIDKFVEAVYCAAVCAVHFDW